MVAEGLTYRDFIIFKELLIKSNEEQKRFIITTTSMDLCKEKEGLNSPRFPSFSFLKEV